MKLSFYQKTRGKITAGVFAAAVLLVLAANAGAQVRGVANSCDRECLRGFVTEYLDAMAKHNPAALTNIKTQRIIAHPDVTYRLVSVDEELGIVVFRQDFGNTGSYGAGNALTMFEAFKIFGGQIHAVEAFMVVMPENTPSGWPAYEVKKPK